MTGATWFGHKDLVQVAQQIDGVRKAIDNT
jgi:hypothetical protein